LPRLSEQFLEELRFRNPIADVVRSYVPLQRAGSNLKGLCPFHSEKSASFVVYEKTNSYYCFGCGAGGDVITFVRSIDNLDYMDAVRSLAQRAGMPMPEDESDGEDRRLRERTLAINRETARFYYQCLASPEGKTARDYLRMRQLTPETVRHFGLGYAPEDFSLLNHLRDAGFSKEELIAAGMKVSKNGNPYDQFHGRLIFPIIDVRGNVIGFGGRRLSDGTNGPKYLNSSDTPAYKKTNGVYALNFAKDTKDSLILCEGYMDVISLHQAGFTNAVASCGTAFTEEQARLLSRYAGEIVLSFDADGPGQKAIARGIEILKQLDVKIRVLRIPGSKDPDEFIKAKGADAFRALLNGATGETDFKLENMRQKYDLLTADGRVAYIKEATALLAEIVSAAEREVYAEKVASAASVSRASLLTEADNLRRKRKNAEKKKTVDRTMKALSGFDDTLNPEKKRSLRAASAEEALLAALLATPEAAQDILAYLPPDEFVTAFDKKLYTAITDLILSYGNFDLGMLGGEFTPAEIGRVQKFMLQNTRRAAGTDELHALADIIREEKHKPTADSVSAMNDDDFKKLIADIGKNKK